MKLQVALLVIALSAVTLLAPGKTTPARAQGGLGTAGSTVRILPGSVMPCAVPFDLWNGVIVFPVIMGDGLPQRAALNTGLPLSLVTPETAAKRGVKPDGTREIDVLDRKITVAKALPQMVRMERVALSGVPFGICDLIAQISGNSPVDAPPIWLGSSALEGLCITIDPLKLEIVVRPANANIPGKVTRVPFALRDGRIWVDVRANGQKFEAIVDTGAAATMLPAKVASELKLTPQTTLEIVDKNGKPAKVGTAKLGEVSLGKLNAKDVPVLFVTQGEPGGISQDFAVIGNDFLFRHRVSIDFGRKEIAFEALPEPPKKKEPKKDPKKEAREASDAKLKDGAGDPTPPPGPKPADPPL